jgi:tripartite-type tricarboxylate transporter receptor subunit TctC
MLQTPASMLTIFPTLYGRGLRYDPLADLVPVTPVCAYSFVLVVDPRHPARDVAGLVAWARARDGLACGNPAAGSMPHFLAVQASLAFGVPVTHVPYRGSAPAVQDVLAGNLPTAMVTLGAVSELQRSGRIRIIGISSAERAPALPDVPTLAEQGFGSLTAEEWIGVLLPARTPAATVAVLHGAVAGAVASPEFQAGLARLDYRALVEAPEVFASRIRAEEAHWAPIVRASGFRPDD